MSGEVRTPGERRVLAEVPSGELVDLSDLSDEERVVSPDLIRRFCIGAEASNVDPRGIYIRGARILEPLDLSFCTVRHPLQFTATTFEATLDVSHAHLPALWIEDSSLPGLRGEGVHLEHDLRLELSEVRREVWLVGAKIQGQLSCAGSTLRNKGGYALNAESSEITGNVFLGAKFSGRVDFLRARIGGRLDCSGATLSNEGGYALVVDRAEISSSVFLRNGFSATGEVRLAGSRISGTLDCSGGTLSNEGGYALQAEGAEINGSVFLRNGFSSTGEARLLGARIGGALDCSGATLSNEGGFTLHAERAEINGNVFLRNGFSSTGQVFLLSARIGGQLDCSGATLSNDGGFALLVDAAEIKSSVFLRNGFSAAGQVRLVGSRIGGQLDCSGASLSNKGGSAMLAEEAEIEGHAFLRMGFNAIGEVRLNGARIGGQLDCLGATLNNEAGNALSAEGAEIDGGLLLRGVGANGQVELAGASIGGQLVCSGATFANRAGTALAARDVTIATALVFRDARVVGGIDLFRASATTLDDDLGSGDHQFGSWLGVEPLVLDGFAYARFGHRAEWGSKLRRRWLEETTGFQQGAWQQLIDVYRTHAHDDDATHAAIAMHNDRVRRAGLSWYRRAGRRVLWAVVGHGYRSWLAGIWAAAIVAAFAIVVWRGSDNFVPERAEATGSPQPVAYAADTFLPIVDFGEAGRWMPTDWARWPEWAVILLGWALTTIFVAGFTRIVRT
jgi:sRNA-binding regulator protein Hfq